MEPTIFVINRKENKNPPKCTNAKNLKSSLKSRSTSSLIVDKQMIESKTVEEGKL